MFCGSLSVETLSQSLATYLGLQLLGQRVGACLVLQETVRPFPEVIVSSTTYESLGRSVSSQHAVLSVLKKILATHVGSGISLLL